MANEKHLKLLARGRDAWNEMRRLHPRIDPDLSDANLQFIHLEKANLRRANLTGTDLMEAYLAEAKLKEATLNNARLGLADLSKANFNDASLWRANITESDLTGAQFCGANLEAVQFHDSDLSAVNFYGAKLNFANFGSADLKHANFSNAEMCWTTFGSNDLSSAKGLNSVVHHGPSVIGIDTIFKSRGNIPKDFLRRAGVPDSIVSTITSLSDAESQFYSCFISFTDADDIFAERLYNDLLNEGIRCWRWKEDAKWGKPLMKSVDEAVATYDKLVVICSQRSLKSPAVLREIERALQREDVLHIQGLLDSDVLFPVRLDDYVFNGWVHHRKSDVIAKNVGDFRLCDDPGSYQKALKRLIRDLKA